jgi:diadenosine tetraphosphatase ApaH/serine/threonine PP2A family protein phosphatase
LNQDVFIELSSLFKALPLACVVQAEDEQAENLFIVHGGVPVVNTGPVALGDIAELDRGVEPTKGSDMITQMLWNDTCPENGIRPSVRGDWGLRVGPDETAKFLAVNGLARVFRSHVEIRGVREEYPGCARGMAISDS